VKILLIQISDIHLRGEDGIISRVDKIASAVRDRDPGVAACFVVVSGDTAFSGLDEQYAAAVGFLGELKEELASYSNNVTEVHIVVIPGNHDCDFEAADIVRKRLLNDVEAHPDQASDEEVIEACTRVQENYRGYLDLLDEGGHLEPYNRLYYEYRYSIGGRNLLFRCYNTAWMSRLHEKQGQIVYPLDKAAEKHDGFDLTVSLLHHPYNWLQSENARALRKHVEEASDVILTGHEHDQTYTVRSGATGETNQYIEGGVLQEPWDESVSTFNVLLVDLDAEKQKFFHFKWDGELYVPMLGSDEHWDELQVNKLMARRDFEVSEGFWEYLEDPGVSLYHPKEGDLKLSQVFVYPDLREVTGNEDMLRMVKGERVLDQVVDGRKVMILGADESGKSALAKRLFRELHERGFVPVFVDGSVLKPRTDEKLYQDFYRLFGEQYSPRFLEKFKQLGRSQRVLIIDDFHRLNLRHPVVRGKFMRLLDDFADRYVLLTNDQAQQYGDLVSGELAGDSLTKLPRYEIEEFGHVARDNLMDKWFSLAEDATVGVPELSRKVNEAHALVNTIIGRNFVPAYPVFVLAVLQAIEVGRSVDTSAGTYGYFYELFIKTNLAKMSDAMEYDVKMGYLSFLAYRMFVERFVEPSVDELKQVHSDYERAYDLPIPFERILSDLQRAGILDEVADGYFAFKYKYIYYYFVANYLKEGISENDVRAQISSMSATIYVEENANILLFLAHLIKDPFTIGCMISEAKKLYDGFAPAKFKDDVILFGEKAATEEVRYSERVASTFRREALQKADEIEWESRAGTGLSRPDPNDEDATDVFEFDVAMKTIQILGQMLKNFPGSLPAEQKSALTTECYELGLRSLGALFAAVKEASEQIVDAIVDYLRTNQRDQAATGQLVERVKGDVNRFARLVAYVVVKNVSHSVGSSALTQTYKRVLENDPSDAKRLIDASIKLDHAADFPDREMAKLGEALESNPFAMFLLRHLVVTHLYMFKVDLDKKQRVCAALNIPYERLKVTDPKARKLGERKPAHSTEEGLTQNSEQVSSGE
jgi:hypothetical protein